MVWQRRMYRRGQAPIHLGCEISNLVVTEGKGGAGERDKGWGIKMIFFFKKKLKCLGLIR